MAESLHNLDALAWDAPRLGEALELLARKPRLLAHATPAPAPPAGLAAADPAALGQWVNLVASQLGIEAEPVESTYVDADRFVRRAAPAILYLPQDETDYAVIASPAGAKQSPSSSEDEIASAPTAGLAMTGPRFLALLRSRNGRVTLLAPDFSERRIPAAVLRAALCAPLEAPRRETIDALLEHAGVAADQRERVAGTILAEQLSAAHLEGGWLLRLSPAAKVWQQARQARLLQPFLTMLGGSLLYQMLVIFTWVIIGRRVFAGQFEWAWLAAWALLQFTGIPLGLLTSSAQGQFATGLSGVFKTRLLYGTLKLQPDEIRHQGLGQFLGRVMEADSVELLAVGGGLTAIMSLILIMIAIGVLGSGIGGWPHTLMLVVWALVTLFLGWRYWQANRAWVTAYRGMTNDLVERMVGHRTRLAQEDAATWHVEEDRDLDRYLRLSEHVDSAGSLLAAIPRAWMVVGLAGIAVAFLVAAPAPARIAISLGGIFLALQALNSIVAGVQNVVSVTQAWDQVGPLFNAATRREEVASIVLPAQPKGENIMLSGLTSEPGPRQAPSEASVRSQTDSSLGSRRDTPSVADPLRVTNVGRVGNPSYEPVFRADSGGTAAPPILTARRDHVPLPGTRSAYPRPVQPGRAPGGSSAARRPVGGRQIYPGRRVGGAAAGRVRLAAPAGLRSAERGRGGVAAPDRGRAPVSREPRLHRDVRLQSVDGTALAAIC